MYQDLSYDFWFSQLFNSPATGFLKSTSLSDPLPTFFPIDGVGSSLYFWRFNGTLRNLSFVVATVETSTPVPEPGLAALTGIALLAAIRRTRRPRQRQRP